MQSAKKNRNLLAFDFEYGTSLKACEQLRSELAISPQFRDLPDLCSLQNATERQDLHNCEPNVLITMLKGFEKLAFKEKKG